MQHVRDTKEYGFSLVEMIVVIALFSIVSLAVTNSISSFYRFNAYTIAQAYQVEHARKGIDLLGRDLREMTFGDDGTFPLAVMEEHLVGFYSDIDRDDSVEYVEYELASTTLEKRIYDSVGIPPVYDFDDPSVTFVLSEYVQNLLQSAPTFVYYDAEGLPATPTSTVTDIRYIETLMIVNIDPIRDPGEYMLRSSSALRNLKETL